MLQDILIQILVAIGIIAAVMLIVVLWKTNNLLDDFKESSKIAKKRIKQIDSSLDNLEGAINNASSMIKGFVSSLETGQKIKDKFKDFWK